jgi:DNA ligase-1
MENDYNDHHNQSANDTFRPGELVMPDLEVGQTIEMKGSSARPYIIKNCGAGGYSCTCPAWRNQSLDPARRTCKHIRKLRGDAAEEARIGASAGLPPPKPEKADEEPPVLLAEAWDNETNLAGWWMSEKLDGVRAYWDGKRFLSRKGNVFVAPPWFTEGLPDMPLDGELWLGRKKFQTAISIVKSRPDEWTQLRFMLFDAPAQGGEFEKRLRFLEDFLRKRSLSYVQLLDQQQCKSVDHLREELVRIEAMGGEGLMMRQPGSRYEAGRSSTLLKVKTFKDAEGRVVGYLAGEGKHKGRVGSLRVAMPNGLLFSVGTGLSDAERSNPPAIGTIITYRYQELTESGVPRFPSYVGIRADGAMTPAPATPAISTGPSHVSVVVPDVPPSAAATAEPITRTFTYGSGDATRVWEVTRRGTEVTLRFGLGDERTTKTQQHQSEAEAIRAVEELVADKLDDGFVESGTAASSAAPVAPAPAAKPTPPPAPAIDFTMKPGVKRRFEFTAGGASGKFWEVWVTGCEMWTRYGKLGGNGQTMVKKLDDESAALANAVKMISQKTGQGYIEKA